MLAEPMPKSLPIRDARSCRRWRCGGADRGWAPGLLSVLFHSPTWGGDIRLIAGETQPVWSHTWYRALQIRV
jgi:hypothetical protein